MFDMFFLFNVSFTEDTLIGLGFNDNVGGYQWINNAPLTYYEWAAEEAEERCVVVGPDARWRSVACGTETIALCSDDGKLMLSVYLSLALKKIISKLLLNVNDNYFVCMYVLY